MNAPQTEAAEIAPDIRPVVASPTSNRAVWVSVAVAAICTGLLFYTLESRRSSATIATLMPATSTASDVMIAPPPELQIPRASPAEMEEPPSNIPSGSPLFPYPMQGRRDGYRTSEMAVPPEAIMPARPDAQPAYAPALPPAPSGSTLVYSGTSPVLSSTPANPPAVKQGERVMAVVFESPATTVPKGTVIQAVLETALDSNRAGFARALVSRDVYGFDGSRILVPKGSRLLGEYKADLNAGQNRALIQWQRLMRPDGVMIDLDSPSADPLGRAGIRGKVNSHFLERFGGAILQSTLDIGVQLAARRVARDTVVLALPGTVTAGPSVTPERVQRTLTVREGTSVSVFVSRDLDFSSVSQ